MTAALEIVFWVSAGLIVWTHLGYPLALWLLAGRRRDDAPAAPAELPNVSVIVAAHDEEDVISERVANVLALDYPRELLELIVASDGSADETVERARAAGADVVLDLGRAGKVPAQNAAAERAAGSCSRSRTRTRPGGPTRCASSSPASPTRASATSPAGSSSPPPTPRERRQRQRGGCLLALRARRPPTRVGARGRHRRQRSDLRGAPRGVPAAAARREPRPRVPVRADEAGLARLYEPAALADERMAATNEAEFARKRRMMRGIWDVVVNDGCSPRAATGRCTPGDREPPRPPLRDAVAPPRRLASNVALVDEGAVYDRRDRRPGRLPRRRGARRRDRPVRCGSRATTSSRPPR